MRPSGAPTAPTDLRDLVLCVSLFAGVVGVLLAAIAFTPPPPTGRGPAEATDPALPPRSLALDFTSGVPGTH